MYEAQSVKFLPQGHAAERRLNPKEIMNGRFMAPCLSHSNCSINVYCYYAAGRMMCQLGTGGPHQAKYLCWEYH